MKNVIRLILLLSVWLPLLVREAAAQTQLELAAAGASTTINGPTTTTLTATLLENTTGTTFVPTSPTTTVTFSLSNHQYTGTYGNINTGIVLGATTNNTSSSVTSTPLYQSMNSVGSPVSATFTSSPCGPAGTGIDVAANYGARVFTSTKPLAGQPTTARYRYPTLP